MFAESASAAFRFREVGYALLPALLDKAFVHLLAEEVEAKLAGPHQAMMARPGNNLVALDWTDTLVRRILLEEEIVRLVQDVSDATDLRWISAYISSKGDATPSLAWHQDWWCWDHPVTLGTAAPQIALLCYLSDTDEETGALRVLPGSHRQAMPLHALLPEAHSHLAHGLPDDHAAMQPSAGQHSLPMQAGDAALIDYRLLHGTFPNRARRRRDAILLSFVPAWNRLPEAIRSHLAMHPALPPREEVPSLPEQLRSLMPLYEGNPVSMRVNRAGPRISMATTTPASARS